MILQTLGCPERKKRFIGASRFIVGGWFPTTPWSCQWVVTTIIIIKKIHEAPQFRSLTLEPENESFETGQAGIIMSGFRYKSAKYKCSISHHPWICILSTKHTHSFAPKFRFQNVSLAPRHWNFTGDVEHVMMVTCHNTGRDALDTRYIDLAMSGREIRLDPPFQLASGVGENGIL